MNRDRNRFTGATTFLSGTNAQPGDVDIPRFFSGPRPSGFDLVSGGGGTAEAEVRQFRVVTVNREYLQCQQVAVSSSGVFSFPSGTATQNIALPVWLRESAWNQATLGGWRYTAAGIHTRTASRAGSPSLTQRINPPYLAAGAVSNPTGGSIIYALRTSDRTGVSDVDDFLQYWIDLNADMRRWHQIMAALNDYIP
jgi:hypothetical protein